MTKLIAALAILAALAWAVTATASWITKKKAPLAIASGRAPTHATAAEQNKAMLRAQLRPAAGTVFALIMFAALFRVSIGITGQAGLPTALTAGLSASGGLLLFSALPATALPATPLTAGLTPARQQLAAKKHFIMPFATLIAFLAFLVVSAQADASYPGWEGALPLALAALALTGSSLLALRRMAKTASLPDPRMAVLDRRWRELSARLVLTFTSGALLAYLGGTAVATGQSLLGTEPASPALGITSLALGSALALAGVVLLVMAAKGAFTIRATALNGTPAPITA
ncbi:hypothetical protein MB46_11005 [Arthrobacter alpinus]|uniref:hypothetical protein n=1 Tax=Arthrobacter alpinus TaxID=656366 RepID=UPI0005CADFC2|nr:hypothetical protein [Arthrobacter alpinus]ALV45934.1 hypothetical protein MB46_11005 [Arthrobacter alpinus]